MLILASFTVAPVALGQYSAKLDCADYALETMSPEAAADLCRGVTYSNLTYVLQCATESGLELPALDLARACQQATAGDISPIWTCLEESIAREFSSAAAGNLCQGVSYRSYSQRFDCLVYATEGGLAIEAAARLCGGPL